MFLAETWYGSYKHFPKKSKAKHNNNNNTNNHNI